jgi:hypothetical protein
VVVVPEHPLARAGFPPEWDAALLSITRRALGDTPLIDLLSRTEADALVDDAQIRAPAAQRVTAEVLRVIAAHGGVGG